MAKRTRLVTITPQDVAAFRAKRGKPTKEQEKAVIAFMEQFDATTIKDALKDRSRRGPNPKIDLKWYVKKLLILYNDSGTTGAVKLQVLDRFLELIGLGAIQDKKLLQEMRSPAALERQPEREDPFDETPLLKVVNPPKRKKRKRA